MPFGGGASCAAHLSLYKGGVCHDWANSEDSVTDVEVSGYYKTGKESGQAIAYGKETTFTVAGGANGFGNDQSASVTFYPKGTVTVTKVSASVEHVHYTGALWDISKPQCLYSYYYDKDNKHLGTITGTGWSGTIKGVHKIVISLINYDSYANWIYRHDNSLYKYQISGSVCSQ